MSENERGQTNRRREMKNRIELKKEDINFQFLWKIKEINVDTITFSKYDINREMSLNNEDMENIVLRDVVGTETHKCTPNVILEMGGKVGEIIKGFTLDKINRTVRVINIILMEEK